jgi:hypothetical protein
MVGDNQQFLMLDGLVCPLYRDAKEYLEKQS